MRGRFLLMLAFSIFLFVSPTLTGQDQEVYSLVRVSTHSPREGLELQLLGLDIVMATPDGNVELVARGRDLPVLIDAGFQYDILIKDLESHFARRLMRDPALGNRAWPEGSMGGYFTNSELEAELDAWAVQYPNLITPKMSIGTTVQGRDIWAVKISDNPNIDENEPEISYDSLIHPREVMGLMTVLYYMTVSYTHLRAHET